MTMTRDQLIARRDELKAQIDASSGWGAAVGAMSEELKGVERALRAQGPSSLDELRTETVPVAVFGGKHRFIVQSGKLYGEPAVFLEPLPDHLAKPPGTVEPLDPAQADRLAPGSVAIVLSNPGTADVLRVSIEEALGEKNWRDDPSADDRWNAGLDFGQMQLCAVLGVNPSSVRWDAATETLDGDVRSVIGNILTEWGGDEWRSTPAGTFQTRNLAWMEECFRDDPSDLPERAARYGEESLELLQAAGMTKEQVLQLVDYVFSRPVGEPGQEMGGAKTCLAGLATYLGLDMDACGEAELARVSTPEMMTKIRGKRSRRHGRGPLPGTTEADLVPEKPHRPAFIGLPLSDGTMI